MRRLAHLLIGASSFFKQELERIGRLKRLSLVLPLLVVAVSMMTVPAVPATAATPTGALLSQKQFEQSANIVLADQDDFGGVTVDPRTHTLFVYRVRSRLTAASAESVLGQIQNTALVNDGSAKLWRVSYTNVANSLAKLQSIQASITTRMPWAQDAKPFLADWYVDYAANVVAVGVTSISPRLASDVSAFGGLVRLSIQPRPSPADRFTDSPPWWGGDQIHNSGGTYCTAGFAVQQRSNGHWGMLTAGHCFSNSTTVYQSGSVMGTETWRVYGGWNYDAAFVDTNSNGGSGPYVWTCSNCYHGVDGWGGDFVGNTVCTDGAVNEQNCTAQITATNICVSYNDGQTLCFMDAAQSTNGSWIVQKGDSGGPVYYYDQSNGVVAIGTISGESGTGQGSNIVYFTPFGSDLKNTFKLYCRNWPSC
jgi:hypothetical protein